jgi:hypothetical protein
VCFLPQIVLVVVVLGRFRVVRAKLPPAKEPKKHSQGVYPISASKGREFCSEHRERPRTIDDDEDEDDWGNGGIKTCDCLYRSDQSSGSALLRHGQAFLFRGEGDRSRRSLWRPTRLDDGVFCFSNRPRGRLGSKSLRNRGHSFPSRT